MLYTKYYDSMPCGFRQEYFYVFPLKILCKTCGPWVGTFLHQVHSLNKLGRGPLGGATYQISSEQFLRGPL